MKNVIENIKAIRLNRGINQDVIADALHFDIANWSRIETGKQELKVSQLEIIANVLQVRVIDLFTYPEEYVSKSSVFDSDRISVTFEIPSNKRDILLSLIGK